MCFKNLPSADGARGACHQPIVKELVSRKGIPERFAALTVAYLEHARTRLGYTHGTITCACA